MAIERLSQASIGAINKYSSMMAGSIWQTDFQFIGSQLVSSPAASVTFSGIDQSFRHLQIRCTFRNTANSMDGYLTFNGGTSYAYHELVGGGGSASANTLTNATVLRPFTSPMNVDGAGIFGTSIVDVLDYTNTNKNKTTRTLYGQIGTNMAATLSSGVYLSTSAVTSLTFSLSGGNFQIGSRFSLYGWN